jgi:pyridoxine kinase
MEAAGFQACCLPTALLSTHGAYAGFALEAQTDFLRRAWSHLKTLDLRFAAVLLGFVGDRAQFPLLEEIAVAVKSTGGLVLVDPILGDGGRRYGLCPADYVPAFRDLIRRADLITPNLTEAALLLGEDPARAIEAAEARAWARALADLGPARVVVTSAPFDSAEQTGVVWHDRLSGRSGRHGHRRVGTGIPGTGDLLAARLLANMLRGLRFDRAVVRAVKGTVGDLRRSRATSRPPLWGPEGPLHL